MTMVIRQATLDDLPRLTAIYNHEVRCGVATFDLHPKTEAERRVWLEAHNVDNHPLLVAEAGGQAVGYASLSPYREKEAYSATVELSIYIDPAHRRQGVATALMEAILQQARRDARTHTVVSVITSGNEASARLHQRFGFTYCGTLHQVGMKFGRYLDIDNYELTV